MNRFLKASICLTLCANFQYVNAAHPSRGLWVGEVALNEVNEATGAVGDSNTYEFTDPQLTTPTSDTAYLRLILHVNNAGQVQLLKSVAIAPVGTLSDGSADLVLLTDPKLYSQHSGVVKRVASASYDFGDVGAVAAVQSLIDTATEAAVAAGKNGASEAVVLAAATAEIQKILDNVDVGIAYLDRGNLGDSFIGPNFFDQAEAEQLGEAVAQQINAETLSSSDLVYAPSYSPLAPNPIATKFNAVVLAAEDLKGAASFYGDTRGIDAVVRILLGSALAVEAMDGASEAEKIAVAKLVAVDEWHNATDTDQAYNRFLAGSSFEQLSGAIVDAAVTAAINANDRGLTEAEIHTDVQDAMLVEATAISAYFDAERVFSESLWDDTRARNAVDAVLLAANNAATAQVLIDPSLVSMTDAVQSASSLAYASINGAYVFATAPSEAYTNFVVSDTFTTAATEAIKAASSEVVFQYNAGVSDVDELTFFVDEATSKALVAERNEAASLPQFSVPLSGELSPGLAISGELYLPALSPTNPFLHRLHPDHRTGIAITRRIAMSVDDSGLDTLSGYGVTLLTGTYEEELFGLHKPLGAQKDIGLKTKGSFRLNRISLVDSLNF